MAKQSEVDGIVAGIEKTHGAGSISRLDGGKVAAVPVIPSGALSLDRALGVGGYPRGRIVEIYGVESSGKTTLTLHAVAECQRAGGLAAFIDAEHALDPAYAKALGVDLGRLLVSQPDSGEQALNICEDLVNTGAVQLVVIDSVAALVPQSEIDGDMGAPTMGVHARLMSQAMRKLCAAAHRSGCLVIFINQIRMKIGVMFGNPETTTGGNALKFYASIRLEVRRKEQVKDATDTAVGNTARVKVVKNKCAPPFREAELDIIWGKGVDAVADLLSVASTLGIVERSGAWFAFAGERLGQGFNNAKNAIAGNEHWRKKIADAVKAAPMR